MARLVPILEFIHEIRSAGLPVDHWAVIDHPGDYWNRLPPDRRVLFLARLGFENPDAEVSDLRVVKRRGRPPTQENVYLRIDLSKRSALASALTFARDRVLFAPIKDDAPAEGGVEEFYVPQSVFHEAGWSDDRRATIDILDRAWGGEPYALDREGAFTRYTPIPGYTEIERYWIDAPFSMVLVLRDDENQIVYHVEEPMLTDLEKALVVTINERLRDTLILDNLDEQELANRRTLLVERVNDLLRAYRFRTDRRTAYKLGYYFIRNYLGFGRLEVLMRDSHIEDISCNGIDLPIYVVHGKHQNVRTNILFGELELNSFILKLAQRGGKFLSLALPLVDATLPDGSRIQASLGREVTSRGSAFTIRKFREDPLTCVDLIRGGTHSLDTMAFLWLAVELKRSLVVMGATASGKTTTLNCLSQFVPPSLKVITIEDTREITLQHENWLAAVTRDSFTGEESERITMFDLLRAALRQRPEYIIVGEIRGAEGLTLFQAMSTGHTCFSTMHAGSVENAVYRLENAPIGVPRVMLTSLDFFLLQGQVEIDGRPSRRMISLTEVNGIDAASRNLRTNEIFRWDSENDAFGPANVSHVIDEARARRGWSRARVEEEIEARRKVLERLVERKERHYRDVSKAIRHFYHGREQRIVPTDPPATKAAGAEPRKVA